jgi:nitroimidazol reductase NimA-like FMN-containing flavoprotein (pyridoxamine 5'-phosphate oxidase superfamily)
MAGPETKLDRRFSDPDAVATEWEETRRVHESAELFWISTVRADGRPHVTPLVAVWLDDAVHFTTGAAEQKAGNLRRNPTVILTTGCNQWDRGLDVVVEGEAVQVTRRRRPRAPRCRTGEAPHPRREHEEFDRSGTRRHSLAHGARGLHPGNRPACRVNGRGIRGAGSAC